jgi:hypothetical protein
MKSILLFMFSREPEATSGKSIFQRPVDQRRASCRRITESSTCWTTFLASGSKRETVSNKNQIATSRKVLKSSAKADHYFLSQFLTAPGWELFLFVVGDCWKPASRPLHCPRRHSRA